ncbi:MAG: nitrile hydratase subunit beta [Proteobacteria bacterium]|nr:nitrile hydratase subunit beta [Pseudomonadota bacterium]
MAARPSPEPDAQQAPTAAPTAFREVTTAPGFQVGDRVRTLAAGKPGHTRLPAYARDRVGEIIRVHGAWVYPDTNAHGQGEQPQHLYTVRFSSEVLWQTPGFSVSLDLFEPYLMFDPQ